MKNLFYILIILFVSVSCRYEQKGNQAIEFIDMSVNVGWTGENGSIRIDSIGNVRVKTEFTRGMNLVDIYYFEYTIEQSSLDSLYDRIKEIDFSKIEKENGEECNRCLAYDIIIKKQNQSKIHVSASVEYGSDSTKNLADLNNLVLDICRSRIPYLRLGLLEKSFESSISSAYPAPVNDQ